MEQLNVVTAPKTGTFQMRINPAIKSELERIYAECGLTLTDAINIFLQQTLNTGALPLVVAGKDALHDQAVARFAAEIRKGRDSVKSEDDWVSEERMLSRFGVKP